ncbi:type III effector HrpK domain-containing protein [Erwinia pyrifoliae]|uniref:type III effector HrpK domain-containing protein n=1 Tax=Erwinia pyrifoliae TaxID=79967 RepID=UPI002207E36A|nr:type III effector HrpK domain-containing protein [Erwinia pyrifoliae]UWS29838.1 type III effector HrpK [Erwinia pyrifoliae]
MRISSTPPSYSHSTPVSPETAAPQAAAKAPSRQDIQFGSAPGQPRDAVVAATLTGLIKAILQAASAQRGEAAKPSAGVKAPPQANSPTVATASGSSASAENSADFLDNSPLSSPDKLEKWQPMVANLAPEQRLQAEKELNRPLAAAQMVLAGGPDAQRAQAYIDANPALKNAIDAGKHGDNPDGKVTRADYQGFIKRMSKARDAADRDINDFLKKHPDADEGSRQMVMEAATLRANEPLVRVAALENGKAGKDMTGEDLKNLVGQNPGLAGSLRQAARSFASPGLLAQLDQGGVSGKKLAQHGPDNRFNTKNIDNWIKKQAPTDGAAFASLINQASLVNATSGVDIKHLDKDVFTHAENYSGAQKAAVMVKLQQTLATVQAGRKLHNTQKTEQALNEKIAQLQNDPSVNDWLEKAVPAQSRALVNGDPGLRQTLDRRYGQIASGKTLSDDMQRLQAGQKDKKTPADYSDALLRLDDELSLQQALRGDGVPTAKEIVARQPALGKQLTDAWQQQIAQGGWVRDHIKDKHADPLQLLAQSDIKKSAYEAVLPQQVTSLKEDGYTEAVMDALKVGKKGVGMLKTLKAAGLLSGNVKKMSGKEILDALNKTDTPLTGMKGLMKTGMGSAAGVAGLFSVAGMLASGNKAGAAKAIYDGVRGGGELAKLGVDTALKTAGRGVSASFGRMAGMAVGRAVGMVAGEASGMAAASAIGAAAGPVGWVVDGVLAIGFGISSIVGAVNKHKEQKRFDHNVDPTLDQFGIPRAH